MGEGPKPAVLHYLWEVTHKGINPEAGQSLEEVVHQIDNNNVNGGRRLSRQSNHGDFNRL